MKKVLSLVLLACTMQAGIAQAGMMDFNFLSNDSTYGASGTIMYNDVTNGINNGSSIGHDITSISGFVTGVGGGAISSLIPNPNQPFPYSSSGYIIDNVVFTTQSFLDNWGVFFSLTNGTKWNLWGNPQIADYQLHSYDTRVDKHGQMTTRVVPEPMTSLLIGLGLLAMVSVARNKKTSTPIRL